MMIDNIGAHWPIEVALAAHAKSFAKLEQEMDNFQPKPLTAFENVATRMWDVMRPANPHLTDPQLKRHIDEQIALGYDASWQRFYQFSERYVGETVTIAILVHACAEAFVNAILAIGLRHANALAEYALIDKESLKSKWVEGPKLFLPGYTLARGNRLHGDLAELCKRRNRYTHSKPTIYDSAGGFVVRGIKEFSVQISANERATHRRLLGLPYELHSYVCSQANDTRLRKELEQLVQQNPLRGWQSRLA